MAAVNDAARGQPRRRVPVGGALNEELLLDIVVPGQVDRRGREDKIVGGIAWWHGDHDRPADGRWLRLCRRASRDGETDEHDRGGESTHQGSSLVSEGITGEGGRSRRSARIGWRDLRENDAGKPQRDDHFQVQRQDRDHLVVRRLLTCPADRGREQLQPEGLRLRTRPAASASAQRWPTGTRVDRPQSHSRSCCPSSLSGSAPGLGTNFCTRPLNTSAMYRLPSWSVVSECGPLKCP